MSVQRQGPIRLTLAKLGGLRPSPPFRKRAEASLMEVLPAEPVLTKARQAGVQSLAEASEEDCREPSDFGDISDEERHSEAEEIGGDSDGAGAARACQHRRMSI